LLLAAAGGVAIPVASSIGVDDRVVFWGIPAALAVWAMVMLEAQGWRYSGKSLLLVGAASYSLYLAHPFAYIPIEKLAHRGHLAHGPMVALLFAGAVAAMLAVGIAVHLLLERPLTEVIRGMTRGRGAQGEARALWPWRLSAKPRDLEGDKSARDD
jgi:peptidoglycan/LPS O-acetylase OafA/YrhL